MAVLYDFGTGQHFGASLDDIQVLMPADLLALPQLCLGTRGLSQRCKVWYATFLGYDHPIV